MNKKLVSTIIFFCLALGASISVFSQSDDTDDFRDEMDGLFYENIFASLRSISVSTSFEDAPLLQGIAENQIEADVITKLSQAGFITDKDSPSLPIYPYLYIKVKSNYSGNSISSFLIEVSYVEEFLLARNQTIKQAEFIWNRKRTIRSDNIEKNTIRDTILNLVERFINVCKTARNNKNKVSVPKTKEPQKTTSTQNPQKINQEDSPFTATYVGGNKPPEVEVFNDTDRTLYLDIGQNKMIAYTIPPNTSKKIQLIAGEHNYKATAPRASSLQGTHDFKKGYRYTWRFVIIKR